MQICHMLKGELNAVTLEAADAGIPVHKVMVVGGTGGDFLSLAKENGCDTLLTGEAAHHEGIEAHVLGVNLVVAGHFRTENPSIPPPNTRGDTAARKTADRMPGRRRRCGKTAARHTAI